MWVESYNTYHLLDGPSFKQFYQKVSPHQVLKTESMQYILKQLKFAVWEQKQRTGAVLDQELRTERLQGGAEFWQDGYNTGEYERTAPFPMRAVDR